MAEVFDIKAKAYGMTWEQFRGNLAGTTRSPRVMLLEEVAHMAVFMASDKASGMTGTTRQLDHGQRRRLGKPLVSLCRTDEPVAEIVPNTQPL